MNMSIGRRMPPLNSSKTTGLLFAFAAIVSLVAIPNRSASAGFPDRIVKIVVPFAPGGATWSLVRWRRR